MTWSEVLDAESASESETTPISVALLDDHEALLDGVASWIRQNAPEFRLTIVARSWLELVHDPAFPTDLVLMDLQLAESVSIEARVRTCRAAGAKVVVLTALDTEEDRSRAMAAGASAYLAKSRPLGETIAIARQVMGVDQLPPTVTVQAPGMPLTRVRRPSLSQGEHEALMHYVEGLTTAEVARAMNVQYETAKTYLRRVREKYNRVDRPTSSRADLIRRSAEDGFLT